MTHKFFRAIDSIIHSDHPFIVLCNDLLHFISYIWNYKIFLTDAKQPIAIANIVTGIILFYVGLKLAKCLSLMVRKKLINNKKIDNSVAISVERILYYLFILLISFFILDITNVPLTTFTVVGTTLALGVGLGSQNIANNFISGLIIMVERPIKLGDIIEVKNIVGEVTNIGARCVSIRTNNNICILIPNSSVLQDSIINWTHEDATLKTSFELYLEHHEDINLIDKVIMQALNENKNILKEPEPKILLKKIEKEGLEFEIEFWFNLNDKIDKKYIINNFNRLIGPVFAMHNIKFAEREQNNININPAH